jgi:hypothetical protein
MYPGLFGLLRPEDGGKTLLQSVVNYLPVDAV